MYSCMPLVCWMVGDPCRKSLAVTTVCVDDAGVVSPWAIGRWRAEGPLVGVFWFAASTL